MTYDALNRMTSWTGPAGSESFTYRGAEWHRFSQSHAGETILFLYDGDNVVLDVGGPGGFTLYVTPFLDQNLSMTRSGAAYYYSHDGLGSVRTLTDSAGAAVNRYDYTVWGEPFEPGTSAAVPQRYAFTGRERNPTSPLMYYRYRQYDARQGRFGQRDPVDRSMAYTYVNNRSATLVDPLGSFPLGVTYGPPFAGVCGHFEWVVYWHLERPAIQDGYVLQNVTIEQTVSKGDRRAVTKTIEYSEIFEIDSSVNPSEPVGNCDQFSQPSQGICSKGVYSEIGYATIFWGAPPKKFTKDGVQAAGGLPSAVGHSSLAGGLGFVIHKISVRWDCTDGRENPTEILYWYVWQEATPPW